MLLNSYVIFLCGYGANIISIAENIDQKDCSAIRIEKIFKKSFFLRTFKYQNFSDFSAIFAVMVLISSIQLKIMTRNIISNNLPPYKKHHHINPSPLFGLIFLSRSENVNAPCSPRYESFKNYNSCKLHFFIVALLMDTPHHQR